MAHELKHFKIIFRSLLRKMSTQKKAGTLASKLAKQAKIIKPNAVLSRQESNVQDIEDLIPSADNVARRYFSPLQTRKQRQQINATSAGAEAVPVKKPRQSDEARPKTTAIKVGSATVISCEVVPHYMQTREAKPKVELQKDVVKIKREPNIEDGEIVPQYKPTNETITETKIKVEKDAVAIKREPKIEEGEVMPQYNPTSETITEAKMKVEKDAVEIKREPKIEEGEIVPQYLPNLEVELQRAAVEIRREPKIEDGETWRPDNWWRQLENIRLMRSQSSAPVDTMGCHECADKSADKKTQRYHKLVALMLSSQTKDKTTYEAMKRLKARTLTPANILAFSTEELEQLLYPVSFHRNKSKYLKQTAQILIDKYDADIPNNLKELLALPGVGPKMAHICMATAWNKVTGIGVDTHVNRISNRLGWIKKPTKEPEHTRIGLESWLPRELWPEVNHLLVGFGQTICAPVHPKCEQCLNICICPAAKPK